MTSRERERLAVMKALLAASVSSSFGDEAYFPFAPLMRRTGLDRATVRRACRVLKRRGHAEFLSGLWTDDGEPAGSGYRLTQAGRDSLGPDVVAAITGEAA